MRAGCGRDQRWWQAALPEARDMPVPASYNDIVPGRSLHDHVGEVWYQTTARVPRGWADQRVVLRFDSATHRATVWVGDTEIMSHEGGYTPFEADVTAHVTPGEEVRITAAVDNTLTWESIPPGLVINTPQGRRQKYMHDFYNYAGLHRSVWLYSTPKTHVSDVTVVPGVTGDLSAADVTGTVSYEVQVAGVGADQAQVRVRLLDAERAAGRPERGQQGDGHDTFSPSLATRRGLSIRPCRRDHRWREGRRLLRPESRRPDGGGPRLRISH